MYIPEFWIGFILGTVFGVLTIIFIALFINAKKKKRWFSITIGEIKFINKEIQRLNAKLVRLESEAYNVTPQLSDSPPGGGASDKVGSVVSQITDIKIDIQALVLKRDMALNLLSREKFEENCIYMRLKLHYSWAKIATAVGSTSDSIRMMCERYSW